MDVIFRGVRGSIAVSGPQYARTGGNTSCVELRHEGRRLILDAGSGLRTLGAALPAGPTVATVVLSHLHWDHIQGIPFFAPVYDPASRLTLVGFGPEGPGLRAELDAHVRPPVFPVTIDAMAGIDRFVDHRSGEPLDIGPFRLTPLTLSHPDGVTGFRVDAGGRSVVFATDVEHGVDIDERLVELAAGVDLLIHDAQYTQAEYEGEGGPSRRGWGHSTWRQALEVAELCDARQVALFHHDPGRDDDALAVVESRARSILPNAFAAREGLTVAL